MLLCRDRDLDIFLSGNIISGLGGCMNISVGFSKCKGLHHQGLKLNPMWKSMFNVTMSKMLSHESRPWGFIRNPRLEKKHFRISNRSMACIWHIYLHEWLILMVNLWANTSIHQYTIYRSYGNVNGSYPPGFLRMVVLPALSRPSTKIRAWAWRQSFREDILQ